MYFWLYKNQFRHISTMRDGLLIWIKRIICVVALLYIPLQSQSAFAQEQQIRSKPKTGEGVYDLLLRNGRGLEYYSEFVKLNKKRLGKDNSLKLGFYYIIPAKRGATDTASVAKNDTDSAVNSGDSAKVKSEADSTPAPVVEASTTGSTVGKTITEPLFGRDKQTFKIESNQLKDACFYIVSGHGGPDPGAIGKMGNHHLHEDEYAYDIALRLARELMLQGAKVHIIIQDAKDGIRDDRILSNSKRETCMGEKIPQSQLARLKQRSDKINQLYAQDKKKYKYARSIFLHIDSRSKHKRVDVFFYHYGVNKAGAQLAETMKSEFSSKYNQHQPSRGFNGTVSTRNLYVLKNTDPVGLFVELGNIQNEFDQRRFVVSSNRQALAKWLSHGFITDYKNQTKR